MIDPRRRPCALALLLAAILVLGGCAGGAASSSPPGSVAPSLGSTTVETPDEAAQLVIASDPRFAGIGPLDPEVIGACCFYQAQVLDDGFEVLVEMGWGDCPSGCSERHRWRYQVSNSGAIELVSEEGPSVPPDLGAGGAGGY